MNDGCGGGVSPSHGKPQAGRRAAHPWPQAGRRAAHPTGGHRRYTAIDKDAAYSGIVAPLRAL